MWCALFCPVLSSRVPVLQDRMTALCEKYPDVLSHVTGSGLLQGVHLNDAVPMLGGNHEGTMSMLGRSRQNGLGIINAAHALKFTSHFQLTSDEISMLVDTLDYTCAGYKKDSEGSN